MEETFYKYLEFERRSSNHTLISYKNDLDQFKKFYNNLSNSEETANADKRSIRSWIIDLSLNNNSKKTINRKIATLKSYYKFLIKYIYYILTCSLKNYYSKKLKNFI